MYTDKIIDFCLDNKELEKKEFNFLLIQQIESTNSYNHELNSIGEACGISKGSIEDKLESVLRGLTSNGYGKASLVVEGLEKEFSKRELSLLLTNFIHRVSVGF